MNKKVSGWYLNSIYFHCWSKVDVRHPGKKSLINFIWLEIQGIANELLDIAMEVRKEAPQTGVFFKKIKKYFLN